MSGHVPSRLALSDVTLCAAASVNVAATARALAASLDKIQFGRCILFTNDASVPVRSEIEFVPIARLTSAAAYSRFILSDVIDHIRTSHCLIAQWDGHVLSAERWCEGFLEYDYVGASWPQFDDGFEVGNGGFSLRSRRLMHLCRDAEFRQGHPEDIAICRTNRVWLEQQGMRFAPVAVADRFSCERTGDPAATFGFHGGFNIPRALGPDVFWEVYRELDDFSGLRRDFIELARAVLRGSNPVRRLARITFDRVCRW